MFDNQTLRSLFRKNFCKLAICRKRNFEQNYYILAEQTNTIFDILQDILQSHPFLIS